MTPTFEQIQEMTPEQAKAYDESIDRINAEAEAAERQRYYCKNVPERYWNESFATYRTDTDERKNALLMTTRLASAVTRRAFFTLKMCGAYGTGKTHLACGMIHELGYGKYATSDGIVEELRRAKSYSANETEDEIVRRYSETKLLVIDEIGRGANPNDEKHSLYMIINARYNTKKPTVLISNFSATQFNAYIGQAAADRIAEQGCTLEFHGESYRRRNG